MFFILCQNQEIMKLWTIQTIEFYDALQKNGVVHCDRESWLCREYREMYDWMADEMRKRIGNPPNPDVRYPLWAWYQYTSRKKPKPPVSPSILDSDQEEGVILEIEIPDNEVLLSDFGLWHVPLNGHPISDDKTLMRRFDAFRATHGGSCDFEDYPEELQHDIMVTWSVIFDLRTRLRQWIAKAMWNRSIQACFWQLKLEQVVKVDFIHK